MQRSMWRFLGDALMTRLADTESPENSYLNTVKNVEVELLSGRISGHEAA
jgi:hypothetical protein